ncbi:MAG: leucine-rich repeat domain-containing protein [Balneolaceae bacterium]
MKKRLFIATLILFLIYTAYNLYRYWGVSGGDLAINLLSFIALLVFLIIISPLVVYYYSKGLNFKNYLVAASGAITGFFISIIIIPLIGFSFYLTSNSYELSNYESSDSTSYSKYQGDFFINNYSNVNVNTITKVKLSDLNLDTLPTPITEIKGLEELDLSLNKNLNLPHIINSLNNPDNLISLQLINCGLTKIPFEFQKLTNLKRLYIGMNPNLKPNQVFEILSQNQNLEELWIQGNDWERLPNSIGNLKELKLLYAKNNNLKELPSSLNELNKLERIFIWGNPVTDNFYDFIDTSRTRVLYKR